MFCPECQKEQARSTVRLTKPFHCDNCGIQLCVPVERAQRLSLAGLIGSAVLLAVIRPGMTWAVILLFPVGILLAILVSIILLEVSPPTLEHYIGHGSLNFK